jgi:protease IV
MSSVDPTPQPSQIVIQQKESMFGRYGKFLIAALVFAIMVIVGMQASYNSYFNPGSGPQEKFLDGSKTATSKIAVINVSGTITEGDTFIKDQIDRVRKDENVVAVVLRINSPGGTVTYSDYLHHKLRDLATGVSREGEVAGEPLPLVVSMGSICASGGYYLASAVGDTPDSIFAEPATITGSIGVILPHYDLSGLLESWSVKDDSIASHPLKDMGSLTKTMTDEEREIFQNLVDEMLADFKEKVKAGRPMFRDSPADLDAVATGQVFTAKQAVDLKLVDKIGFIEDALARAAVLANTSVDEVRCVEYEQAPGALDALLGTAHAKRNTGTLNIDTLLELSTPRAYYMCTWLPGVTSAGK